ncbi:MAG TPA: LysR substrate-binding domain-containing protein [Xanthomonadaceae bacterium]|nr:LysR substrate-binding domain-containing protein [Xanthomonadaceae bacterium]
MNLTQLRYLVAIADSGFDVAVAANAVDAKASAVSRQVRDLENELGFDLFNRDGGSLDGISDAGEEIVSYARRALEETRNIDTYAANKRGDQSGRLRLSTSHMLARYVLPSAIAKVNAAFPQVRIDLQPAADVDVLQRISRNDFDLGFVSTAGPRPRGKIVVPLFQWKRVILVPSWHPLAFRPVPLSMGELAAHPLVIYESSEHSDSSLRTAFVREGLQPRVAVSARDASLIEVYVRAGLGAGVIAEMALERAEIPNLRAVAAPIALALCTAWAVVPTGRVTRDYTLALLQSIAPQLDRRDLVESFEGQHEASWPIPPIWPHLDRPISNSNSQGSLYTW